MLTGKVVSQMTPEERKLFDDEFQYDFGNQSKQRPTVAKSPLPAVPTGSTMSFLKRMNLVVKKNVKTIAISNKMLHLMVCKFVVERRFQDQRVILI